MENQSFTQNIKTLSLKHMYRLPFNLQESISSCKKWLLGKIKISIIIYLAMNSNIYINAGEMKWFRRGTKKDFVYSGSFQEAIGLVLVIGQLCGLMPVVGVMASSASQLRFKWISFRTLYSFVVFLSVLMYEIMTAIVAFERDLQFEQVGK